MNWRKRKVNFCHILYKEIARKNVCSGHTHTPRSYYYAVPPTPTITQHDMKSIVILSLFTRCSMGSLADSDAYPTQNRQMQCTWGIWTKKKKRKACLFTYYFLLENINLRENHFQFTSHDWKYFLNFYLEFSRWNKLAFPKECEVYPLQSLRYDEMLATRITCLALQHDYCI